MVSADQVMGSDSEPRKIRTKTYVISIRDAQLRRDAMARQLDRSGLDWAFFDAHTMPIKSLTLDRRAWLCLNGRELSDRELACYSSHYGLISDFASNDNIDVLIIFEDDAAIDVEYLANINEFARLVKRYGYIRLNAQNIASASLVYIQGRRRLLRFRKSVYGGLAYALDKKTAKLFVSHLKKVRRPVDVELDRFWDHGIPILCLYQPVAIECSQITQIGARYFTVTGLNWFAWKVHNQIEKIRCAFANILYDLRIKSL